MKQLSDHLQRDGCARISAHSPDETTLAVAERIGAVSSIRGVSSVQELAPRRTEEAAPTSYGGIYGLSAFPLHTDMAHWHIPPRYLLLRCISAAPVETLVVHFREVLADEDDVTLRRSVFRPRRRIEGRLTSLRLKHGEMHRWDPIFIVPVTAEAERLRERLVTRLSSTSAAKLALDGPTDCLLLDNWAVMHGRTHVPPTAMHRRLERVYLDFVRR